jgi:hypothetical protein
MWVLVAAILIVWLIIVLFPSILAILVLLVVSVLDSPAFLKIESAREKIGAFLGKIFPAYMPPKA